MFDVEGSQPIASLKCGGFEECFNRPMYNKYEDRYSEDEGPIWDVSLCSSNSELLYPEEHSSIDFIKEISCEMHEGK